MTDRTEILYRFTVGDPIELDKEALQSSNYASPVELSKFYDTQGGSYIFTKHQMKFKIKMSDKPTPNIGHVTLFNIDTDLRDYLQANSGNHLVCILEAGDNVQGLKTVYKGTVSNVKYTDDNTENKVKLTITDGGLNVKSAFTVRGYPRGTPYSTVVKDLCEDLQLPVGILDGVGGTLASPVSFMGDTHSMLELNLNPRGLSYSIQNGEVNILPERYRRSTTVSVINLTSGLLGNVSPLVDDSKSTVGGSSSESEAITFRCLLDGALAPTESVFIEEGKYKGAYKLTSVIFQGDFEGNLWICECIAKPTEGELLTL